MLLRLLQRCFAGERSIDGAAADFADGLRDDVAALGKRQSEVVELHARQPFDDLGQLLRGSQWREGDSNPARPPDATEMGEAEA
jgi:hypothetical protein